MLTMNMIAPLGLTIVEIIIMQDYFGHHPWMASPVLLVGALFSLALLRALTPLGSFDKIPLAVVPAATVFCFLYGLAVLIFFRANELNSLSMVALVRENTPRSDDIVVVKSADPASAPVANRFDEEVDLHVVVVDDFNSLAAEVTILSCPQSRLIPSPSTSLPIIGGRPRVGQPSGRLVQSFHCPSGSRQPDGTSLYWIRLPKQ